MKETMRFCRSCMSTLELAWSAKAISCEVVEGSCEGCGHAIGTNDIRIDKLGVIPDIFHESWLFKTQDVERVVARFGMKLGEGHLFPYPREKALLVFDGLPCSLCARPLPPRPELYVCPKHKMGGWCFSEEDARRMIELREQVNTKGGNT